MNLRVKLESFLNHIRSLSHLERGANRLDRLFMIERERAFREIIASDPRLADARSLNRYEYQVFSQCGQDGILAEIFSRLQVREGFCVEFGVGVGNGFETNTTNLILQGWRGLWIEGSGDLCAAIRGNFQALLKKGRLRLTEAFLTRENIAEIFRRESVPAEFDLLSIDIDGNDLWMWEALRDFRPKCVSIEYNAHFPAGQEWVISYRADRVWNATIEYGASAKALERVGAAMGYSLVACDVTGCDCFFVRTDLCADRFAGPFTAEQWHHPCRHYLIARPGHIRRLIEPFSSMDARPS